MRENLKRMSGNGIREIRDNSKAVLGMGSLVSRCADGQGCMRKSRGRLRM